MSVKFLLYNLIITLFYFSCAAQGPASGGNADKEGPILNLVQPENLSIKLARDQHITLFFHELLDPASIPASIRLADDLDYKLKIRSRHIIIAPKTFWPENQIITIYLSRKIRDFQKNIMKEPIQLVYTTGSALPSGQINGRIMNTDIMNLVEVGLYEWPINDSSDYIQKVEADEKGFFQFSCIKYGKYTLASIEGALSNIKTQIQNKRYALLTSNFIQLSPGNTEKNIELLLSEPLKQLKISSIEMQSQYTSNLLMNDKSTELFIIDSLYLPGDTVFVNLIKSNRIETYKLPEYSFILPTINDTLPPKLSDTIHDAAGLKLIFSEPIIINKASIISGKDSNTVQIPFQFFNEYTLLVSNLPDSITKINLIGEFIKDWAGNQLRDSLKVITISRKEEKEEIIGGNIIGYIEYKGGFPIKIEAHQIKTDKYYYANVHDNKFILTDVIPGIYKLWGYEVVNVSNPDLYYSGTWDPFKRASRFSIYADSIDVRAHWDVEGINLNFE